MRHCVHFFMATVLLLGFACNAESPPTEESSQSVESSVKESGIRLEVLAVALAQEQQRKASILELAAARAARLQNLTSGDPHAIAEAQRVALEVRAELAAKKAKQDALMEAPASELAEAKGALASAEEVLSEAQAKLGDIAGEYSTGDRQDRCGSDGCDGQCDDCAWADAVCFGYYCRCLPDCKGKECGEDGCGAYCGSGGCGEGSYCSEEGKCLPRPQETKCRPDCRGIPDGPKTSYRRVRDYSTHHKSRRWNPKAIGTPDELEEYLGALTSRRVELDGLVAGGVSLQKKLAETEARLEEAEALLESTRDAIGEGRKNLKDAKKTLRTVSEEEKEASEAKISELEAAQAKRRKEVAKIRETISSLKDSLKEHERALKSIERDLPELKEGLRRIGPEITRIEAAVAHWKELKAGVEGRKKDVEAATEAVTRAAEALAARMEAVGEAKNAQEESFAPRIEAADNVLAELLAPAFAEPLVGAAPGDGLNRESRFVVELQEPDRLQRIIETATALREQRKAVWAKLDVEQRSAHEEWPTTMEVLDGYLIILASLEDTEARCRGLETSLISERTRLLETSE